MRHLTPHHADIGLHGDHGEVAALKDVKIGLIVRAVLRI